MACDEESAKEDDLLGVVGDRPGGHARGDGVARRGWFEAVDLSAPAFGDLTAGEHLGGHAQRIADGQSIQHASGAFAGFHDHKNSNAGDSQLRLTRDLERWHNRFPRLAGGRFRRAEPMAAVTAPRASSAHAAPASPTQNSMNVAFY